MIWAPNCDVGVRGDRVTLKYGGPTPWQLQAGLKNTELAFCLTTTRAEAECYRPPPAWSKGGVKKSSCSCEADDGKTWNNLSACGLRPTKCVQADLLVRCFQDIRHIR